MSWSASVLTVDRKGVENVLRIVVVGVSYGTRCRLVITSTTLRDARRPPRPTADGFGIYLLLRASRDARRRRHTFCVFLVMRRLSVFAPALPVVGEGGTNTGKTSSFTRILFRDEFPAALHLPSGTL